MRQSLANLRRFQSDPIALMRDIRSECGDLAKLRIGPKPFYFAFHPDHARRVLSENLANYPKSRFVFNRILPVTGPTGLVQLSGEKWASYRQLTNRIFQSEALASHLAPIHKVSGEALDELARSLPPGGEIDISDLMTKLILRTASLLFFGVDVKTEAAELGESFVRLNRFCGQRFRSPLAPPSFVPTNRNLAARRDRKRIHHFFQSLESAQADRNSLLSILREAQEKHTHTREVRSVDQLLTFLFAGHETTASSLSWALYLLARYPRYQEAIRAERGALPLGELTLDAVGKLRWARAVYQEALRLYPPAWVLAREIRDDDKLSSYRVKRGATLLLSVREIHRHPEFWQEPELFSPERFLDGKRARHPFAFIPFGGGPRVCSGAGLAMVEAVTILSLFVSRFQLSVSSDLPPEAEAMITLHPKGRLGLKVHELTH